MPLVRTTAWRVECADAAMNRNQYIPCGRNFIGHSHARSIVAKMVCTRATLLSDDDFKTEGAASCDTPKSSGTQHHELSAVAGTKLAPRCSPTRTKTLD